MELNEGVLVQQRVSSRISERKRKMRDTKKANGLIKTLGTVLTIVSACGGLSVITIEAIGKGSAPISFAVGVAMCTLAGSVGAFHALERRSYEDLKKGIADLKEEIRNLGLRIRPGGE